MPAPITRTVGHGMSSQTMVEVGGTVQGATLGAILGTLLGLAGEHPVLGGLVGAGIGGVAGWIFGGKVAQAAASSSTTTG